MNTSTRYLLVAASAAALAVTASAQLLSGAANSATAVRPALPTPPPPPPISATAATAAQNAATTAATVRAPIAPTVNATAATTSQAGASVSVARDVNLTAQADGATQAAIHSVALDHHASHQASLTLSPADTIESIRQAAHATRTTLAAEIQAKVDASSDALAQLKARADEAGARTRSEFGRALRVVRSKEKELRASLKDAVKAKTETAWGEVQSALARDYSAYAEAVASAEAALQGSVALNEQPAAEEPQS